MSIVSSMRNLDLRKCAIPTRTVGSFFVFPPLLKILPQVMDELGIDKTILNREVAHSDPNINSFTTKPEYK